MGEPALTPPLFAIFSDLIEKACGVHYDAGDRPILESKLSTHATELGFDSLLDYYYRLRYDDPGAVELHKLVEAILVHETYFFREYRQLVQLCDHYLTDLVRTRGRARVWSAACSTGEEPFTLAMLLEERGLLDHVEIVASDVSSDTIVRAKAGLHGKRALRDGHPPEVASRYLDAGAAGYAVVPRIRDAVKFATINLLDDASVRKLGRFDAILCRNVLIYFHDAQILKVLERLARSLEPGGLIAVGVSESLLRFGTSLVCEERGNAFFYRSGA
ncbi:MAG: protein-glutamate O-methyltransferase CheR [Deltaproteobacteria bacterium]|nr:protein-glutamate O-methyltransferase CheR [Deltaproteobacteria bacterium]MDQ3296225.1 protein-glutamate O-methyltransferase CheR [Myxococcota bacterium]